MHDVNTVAEATKAAQILYTRLRILLLLLLRAVGTEPSCMPDGHLSESAANKPADDLLIVHGSVGVEEHEQLED